METSHSVSASVILATDDVQAVAWNERKKRREKKLGEASYDLTHLSAGVQGRLNKSEEILIKKKTSQKKLVGVWTCDLGDQGRRPSCISLQRRLERPAPCFIWNSEPFPFECVSSKDQPFWMCERADYWFRLQVSINLY